MLPSLRARLAIAALLLAATAVLVTAFAVQRLTESDIRSAIQRDLDTELFIRDSLAFYSFDRGSWDGVAAEVETLSQNTGQRIAVATLAGKILADSEQLRFGREAALPQQALIVDPQNPLFGFNVAPDELALIDAQNELTATCLELLGIEYSMVSDDQFGVEVLLPNPALSDTLEENLLGCLSDTDIGEFGVFTDTGFDFNDPNGFGFEVTEVEPLQLFVGYGDDNASSLFPSLRSARFWIAVTTLLALAGALASWAATRIARPIALLTVAAQRMSDGDRGARVTVNGSDEVGQLGVAFNNMADSLEAEDQARKTLTTDVAHELRSPLANLRGYIEAIQDGVVQPDNATIDSLHDEAVILQALVEDLQQLSLAEVGGLSLHRAPTGLGELVERIVAGHQANARASQVELTAVCKKDVEVSLDPDRMRQVLANLVTNALRHTDPGDSIQLTTEAGPEWVKVRVTDTGQGIAAEHLPHIFDRFYRADSARSRATGGSGLGLAITRALVHAHDGTIQVTSTLNQGTTFTVALPR